MRRMHTREQHTSSSGNSRGRRTRAAHIHEGGGLCCCAVGKGKTIVAERFGSVRIGSDRIGVLESVRVFRPVCYMTAQSVPLHPLHPSLSFSLSRSASAAFCLKEALSS